jgi:hypothetical protein
MPAGWLFRSFRDFEIRIGEQGDVIGSSLGRASDMTSSSRGALRPGRAIDRPSKNERAQGMPGEGLTHGPRATKKHAAEPQVGPIIRHSLRGGFNAYT